MEKLVSSRLTPLYKFVMPVVLGALTGYGDYVVWIVHQSAMRNTLTGILARERWMLLVAVSIAFMALVLWVAIPLKRVVLVEGGLRISNYVMEIFVPLGEIQEVGHLGWTQPRRATIKFRTRTRFGKRITVIPPMQRTFDTRAESEPLEWVRRAMLLH